MNLPTLEAFTKTSTANGCTEVLVREWTPNQELAEHTHPFRADALIVQGEMWLITKEQTQHLKVGDTFHLDAHVPHSEKYGPQGAVYWVARTNA